MPTGQWPSLVDLASRSVYDKQTRIAEMLSQSIALYDDLPMEEANEMAGHEFVYRTSIPAGSWRQINQGVPYSKSTTGEVARGHLRRASEDYSQVDRRVAG